MLWEISDPEMGWFLWSKLEQRGYMISVLFAIAQFSINVPFDRRFGIVGIVQDCSYSIADALGLLQPCTKPSI